METTQKAAKLNVVRVRIKHGRVLVKRSEERDVYAEQGDVIEVDKNWAEALLGRRLEGYIPDPRTGQPGERVGTWSDSPIEIVA